MKHIFCRCVSAVMLLSLPFATSANAFSSHFPIENTTPAITIEYNAEPEVPAASCHGTVMLADTDAVLPPVYDPRNGAIPLNPIEYRVKADDLWAYQATAALELSAYKTSGQMQKFSEQHMLASLTFDRANPYTASRTSGGNRLFSTAYAVRSSGPVLKSDFDDTDYRTFLDTNSNTDLSLPENNTYDASLLKIGPETHTHIPVEFLTAASEGTYSNRFADETSEGLNTNYEKIKRAVYQYGAVSTDYYMYETDSSGLPTKFYNPETSAYFYRNLNYNSDDQPCDEVGVPIPANGTITIVGWDDDYSILNFNDNNLPPQNGAWIVRTDRGSSWGDKGYEYISYYDHMFGRNATLYKITDETYNHIYQYDPLLNLTSSAINPQKIGTLSSKLGTKSLWIANRFEKNDPLPETICAIGFYVQSYQYAAELYIDPSPGTTTPGSSFGEKLQPIPLKNGDLGLPTQITFPSPGFYVLELQNPINITNTFDVVLRLENVQNAQAKSIVLGIAAGNSLSGNLTRAGYSFYSTTVGTGSSNSTWHKLSANIGGVDTPANWNIKAYTNIEKPAYTAQKTDNGIQFTLKDTETDKYTESKIVTAFYDKKNVLLGTSIIDTPPFQQEDSLPFCTFSIDNSDIPLNAVKCRSFIWNDLDSLSPAADFVTEIIL